MITNLKIYSKVSGVKHQSNKKAVSISTELFRFKCYCITTILAISCFTLKNLFITLKDYFFQNDALVPRCLHKCFETQTSLTEVAWEMHFQPIRDTQFSKFSREHSLRSQGSTSNKRKVQGCSWQTYGYDSKIWVLNSIFTFGEPQK